MEESAPNKNLEVSLLQKIGGGLFSLRRTEKSIYLQLVVLLGIALLIAATLYFFMGVVQDKSIREQSTAGLAQTSDQDKKLADIKLKSSQDQQRKNDVATINSALKSFFLKEKKAPDSLNGLVPDYLQKLPTDPLTQKEYSYKLANDKKSWQVAANLSDGSSFQAKGP